VYIVTKLHGVTSQETVILTFIALRTIDVLHFLCIEFNRKQLLLLLLLLLVMAVAVVVMVIVVILRVVVVLVGQETLKERDF
jgi:hypothetical protein